MSTSEPTFVTPSFQVNDGSTRAVWTMLDSSGPAVHGGPGSGCVPAMRQLFNPAAYRVVLFDQRGCGRSTPHASDPTVELSSNTTDHLIADIELLRIHLGVDRWVVAGWSWGTTLALAYAEECPQRVSALLLTAVTTTTPREVQWITRDVGRLFPAEWVRFRDALPEADRDGVEPALVEEPACLLGNELSCLLLLALPQPRLGLHNDMVPEFILPH